MIGLLSAASPGRILLGTGLILTGCGLLLWDWRQ